MVLHCCGLDTFWLENFLPQLFLVIVAQKCYCKSFITTSFSTFEKCGNTPCKMVGAQRKKYALFINRRKSIHRTRHFRHIYSGKGNARRAKK